MNAKINENTSVSLSTVFILLGSLFSLFVIVLVPVLVWAVRADFQLIKVPGLERRQTEMYYDLKAIKKAMNLPEKEVIPGGEDGKD